MRTLPLIALALATLAVPAPGWAQTAPAPAAQAQQPSRAPRTTTLGADKIQRGYAHLFRNLNLSSDQQQQMQQYVNTFAQQHPEGSPRDRQAERALRQQMLGTLSADQQAAFKQQMQQLRAQRQARMQQQQQPPQGQPPQGDQSQGQPPAGDPSQGQPPAGQPPA